MNVEIITLETGHSFTVTNVGSNEIVDGLTLMGVSAELAWDMVARLTPTQAQWMSGVYVRVV